MWDEFSLRFRGAGLHLSPAGNSRIDDVGGMEDGTQRHHRRIDGRGRWTRYRRVAVAEDGGNDYGTVLGFTDTANNLVTGGQGGRTGLKAENTDSLRWHRVLPRSGISSDDGY